MDLRVTIRLAVAVLAFAALEAGADVYKWTDANGRVVYGDTPPPGVIATRVSSTVAPADPSAVQDMASRQQQFNKRAQERADDEAKAQKADVDAKAKLDRCVQLSGRLQALRVKGTVYKFDDKGAKIPFAPGEREQSIAETEKMLADLGCPSGPSG